MTAITIKQLPEEIHRKIKRMQLDLEDEGVKKTLEEIYIGLLKEGIKVSEKEKAAK